MDEHLARVEDTLAPARERGARDERAGDESTLVLDGVRERRGVVTWPDGHETKGIDKL